MPFVKIDLNLCKFYSHTELSISKLEYKRCHGYLPDTGSNCCMVQRKENSCYFVLLWLYETGTRWFGISGLLGVEDEDMHYGPGERRDLQGAEEGKLFSCSK